jgi:lysine-ketoglutarate reductase/saccharopine dehydrogenase-like protein (TIGR00300 family)
MVWSMPKYQKPDFKQERLVTAPNIVLQAAPKDGAAPEGYHATSIFPEYFKVEGHWLLAEESRMDCVAVYKEGRIQVVEFRNLHQGDLVVLGRTESGQEGIYVHVNGFVSEAQPKDKFAFRQGRSRETAYSKDYDSLYAVLRHEKRYGKIVWVMGPACAFDANSRKAFCRLIRNGYVDGLMAGNALATHDLEASYLRTALGQDVYTQKLAPLGHYHHLDTINKIRLDGGIHQFIEKEKLEDGIMISCDRCHIPFVLVGSIRDDGPLPEVYGNVYEGQDAMRNMVRDATTVICMASTLHTVATGNMFPSYRVINGKVRPTYFYSVDISEFAVNKLLDRGSLSVKTIVTNVQDFIVNVAGGVCDGKGKI